MSDLLTLTDLFDLRPESPTTWIGRADGQGLPHLFGGQLVAQSVVAAGLSAPRERSVHSLHTIFMRAGQVDTPVTYEVHSLRDGASVSSRQVDAWQGSRLICRSMLSLTELEGGISHSRGNPSGATPEESISLQDLAEPHGGLGQYWDGLSAVEIRVEPVGDPDPVTSPGRSPSAAAPRNVWMRAIHDLGDDPLYHRAAMAYASDLMLISAAVIPHGYDLGHEKQLAQDWNAVSLDHTVWFHRDTRADEWLLFEHASPGAHASRALVMASIFDREGTTVGHVAQEALVRRREG
ncbi:acyl-CoA thioesterase [Nocardioides sp.]|uniref:acyl-CoA thioesterase n=1 Tax=Nocardioides sp. TaxID=35761 RepID=UPI0039E3E619